MPNRIIKESICTSETIDQLTPFEETFFYRLIVNCDDYGRLDARPAILKAKLFPLKERLTLKEIQGALNKLAGIGCVKLYEVEQKPYLYFPAWLVHQRVRNSREKYPKPEEGNDLRQVAASCGENLLESNPIQSESNPNPNPNPNAKLSDLFANYTQNESLLQSINDFIEFRKKIRAPMTDRAIQLFLNELNKLSTDDETKIAIINQSIVNGWKGIFPLKGGGSNGRITENPKPAPKPKYDKSKFLAPETL